MSKFEQLLDLLVNEETEKANELFHEIVVEKSRTIYENLIAEEAEKDEEELEEEESEDDTEDNDLEEAFGEPEGDEGGLPVEDETDDFVDDTTDDPMSGDEGHDEGGDAPATAADVQDLEDALEELKAEFEKLMAGEKHEEEENPDIHGGELDDFDTDGTPKDEEDSDEDNMEYDDDQEESYTFGENRQLTREYREKVGNDWDKNAQKTDNQIAGANTGEKMPAAVASKSPISSGSGKPTSGANAKNIAQGGTGVGNNTGTTPNAKGPAGVLKSGGDFVPAGTKNVSSSSTSKMPDGAKLAGVPKPNRTAEFKGVGANTGGPAGQTGSGNTKSVVDHKI